MTARNHHYLSQCYLKGFTKGGAKKSKLTVIDYWDRRSFETIPRNVGAIRDFNRVDIEGVDQNVVESSLADFEGQVAAALKKVDETLEFDGENKDLILNFVALLAIRSPQKREHWKKFQTEIFERVLDLSLSSEVRWKSQMRDMKESGEVTNDDLSFEDVRKFFDSKQYQIEIPNAHNIEMESAGIEAILPCLYGRNWILIKSTSETGPFITTDHPVILAWKEPTKIPPLYRNSPGHGMIDTEICFPLSKNVVLVGEFNGKDGCVIGNKKLVTLINSKMLMFAYRQIYAPKMDFSFYGEDWAILNGNQILSRK